MSWCKWLCVREQRNVLASLNICYNTAIFLTPFKLYFLSLFIILSIKVLLKIHSFAYYQFWTWIYLDIQKGHVFSADEVASNAQFIPKAIRKCTRTFSPTYIDNTQVKIQGYTHASSAPLQINFSISLYKSFNASTNISISVYMSPSPSAFVIRLIFSLDSFQKNKFFQD